MAHGGARPGAGRKPGTPNRATQEQRDAVAASGLTPLDYLLTVMRDEGNPTDTRLDAAKAAASYVHPKLSAVTMDATVTTNHEDALGELE